MRPTGFAWRPHWFLFFSLWIYSSSVNSTRTFLVITVPGPESRKLLWAPGRLGKSGHLAPSPPAPRTLTPTPVCPRSLVAGGRFGAGVGESPDSFVFTVSVRTFARPVRARARIWLRRVAVPPVKAGAASTPVARTPPGATHAFSSGWHQGRINERCVKVRCLAQPPQGLRSPPRRGGLGARGEAGAFCERPRETTPPPLFHLFLS